MSHEIAHPQTPNDPEVVARKRELERKNLEHVRDEIISRLAVNFSAEELLRAAWVNMLHLHDRFSTDFCVLKHVMLAIAEIEGEVPY